jgi:tetratricopeptide (TPR) repeat protein
MSTAEVEREPFMRMAWFASFAVILFAASPAWADAKDDAREHTKVAAQHYKLGRFRDALDEYSKAYELVPAAPLLFNIAQCWRNLGNHERAVFFLEGYLREAKADAANRPIAQELVVEERRLYEEQQAEERRRAEKEQQQKDETEQERKAREAEERKLIEARRLREEEEARRVAALRKADSQRMPKIWEKWWFWSVVGGVAVAGGAAAWYFNPEVTTVPPMGTLGTADHRGIAP